MGQELNNSVENVTTVNEQNVSWDSIYKQLQRIDSIDSRTVQMFHIVKSTQREIENIKKIQNIQENTESQTDKKQNVIDDQKQPKSTLSSSQKKRYQNIGAQFVKGAGKQFEKIKKAVQTKQKMKTSKQEQIVQKVKTTQKRIKKQKVGSGFWKKLLVVVGILGVIAIMFRDKIANLLPDLTNGTQSMGQKIIGAFTGLVGTLVDSCVKFIGGGLGGIITYVCTTILPGTIQGFFNDTLPMAMVASTLAVLSMFSQGAGQQLQTLLGQRTGDKAYSDEYVADKRVKGQSEYVQNVLNTTVGQLNEQKMSLQKTRAIYANSMYAHGGSGDIGFSDESRAAMKKLGQISGFAKLEQMINAGNFDLGSFLIQLQKINSNQKLSVKEKNEKYDKLFKKYFNGEVDYSSFIKQGNGKNVSLLVDMAKRMTENKTYREISAAISQNSRNSFEASLGSVGGTTLTTTLVTKINVNGAILSSVADKILKVIQSIDSFLNGSKTNLSFTKKVGQFFEFLANCCGALYESFAYVLAEIMDFADENLFYQPIDYKEGKLPFGKIKLVTQQGEGKKEPIDGICNVLVMNVSAFSIAGVQSLIGSINSHAVNATDNVKRCVSTLQKINSLVETQIIIQSGGQGVDISQFANSVGEVAGKVTTLQGKVSDLEKNKMDKPQGDTGGNGKPPRGTQTGS